MLVKSLDNEIELLSRVAKGDEKAFRLLFSHYWGKIYSVAFTLTKSAELAEEIVQDVFLKIWLKKEQLPSIAKFESYLFIAARNHILNQLRKRTYDQHFAEHLEKHFSASAVSPEQEMLLKETNQLIHKALGQLPARQREVYELSRNQGLDTVTIARQLGISKLTVKSHMTKALQFIRHYLQPFPDKLLLLLFIEHFLL
jgi:RNA polymerase sigma-70 factor (ECF subfamily)